MFGGKYTVDMTNIYMEGVENRQGIDGITHQQIRQQTRVLLQCIYRSPFHGYNNENVCSICLHHYYNICQIRLALIYFLATHSRIMKG